MEDEKVQDDDVQTKEHDDVEDDVEESDEKAAGDEGEDDVFCRR